LNQNEINTFIKLKKSEQKHCINVSKDVAQICFNNNIKCDTLIKVALLHDIGKINIKLNIIEKSLLVIVHAITKGKIIRVKKIKKIYRYYNHGKIGADILRNYGYDNRFLYLIENHHNKHISEDEELNIIKSCDDRN
jgi:putative nucleotidyltransferase with HDIG domain